MGVTTVWYAYLSENFTNIKSVNFRDKGKGWKNYRLTISTDRSVIDQSRYDNLYMKLFLENVSLRPSCYNCRFKTLDRKSDFTIADYWGAQNLSPELFDDKGASIVLLHSEKAEKIWDAIKENIKNVPITKEMILQSNPMALRSVRKPITRKKFFEILDSCGMHHAAQYATQMTAKRKLYIYIKRIVKGMLGG